MAQLIEQVPTSFVTDDGYTAIPPEIREYLHLGPGDRVRYFKDSSGNVVMLPVLPVEKLYGIVESRAGGPVTLEDIERGIAEGASESAVRGLK